MNNSLKSQFLLNPEVTYLNFGSSGACAKPVFENYQQWQRELESEPWQFFNVNGPRYLYESRVALASYVHCDPDDIVYVTNPSYAVNIIAKNLDLQPGDEVLSTNLEYGACDKTWNYYCKKKGAKYIRKPIQLPLTTREEIVADFIKGINSRTKAVFISHITSVTALILPVAEICAIAKQKGILTIVDGAHVPGHIPLDITALDADIYTGACHKWMMTPKSCSFLYVKRELQHLFDPLLISWGYDSNTPSQSQFIDYHQLQGTRDYSAFLTVPKTIRFMKENDWDTVSKRCRDIVRSNASRFCDLLQTKPISPITEEFLGQMLSIPFTLPEPMKLQRHLFEKYKIEIPLMTQDGNTYMRYSINGYNSQEDLDYLYKALKESMI